MTIFLSIEKALESKLPFVVYRKPNTTLLKGWFQKNDNLYTSKEYTESGFIFAPFDDKNAAILLPKEHSLFQEEEALFKIDLSDENNFEPDYSSEKSHINLVEKGIKAIDENQFKKVVLSRKEELKLTDFNAIKTFKKLLANYPNAFTYIWFHPKVGTWLGATPETLVQIKDNNFKTMSLAGTQVFNNTTNVSWSPKEIEEQQFVTDYITDKLISICKKTVKGTVKTIKAGNLLHLRTLISGEMNSENSTLIKKLHPTPAVCGLPLETSKAFILKNENYNRSYYTGFLGELNLKIDTKNTSELFVNLRCMEIKNSSAFIFIGGGITKESNPKSEWKETIAKTKTMKKIL
ncbi:isochorismate synthase [Tenacibaculum retecalamus]|uniref:isochorismate synthase n=1 Tax=Tenacibaculum retecalamus TaxID=3018315 RepID=UPI0023D922F7|nr:isochorismate synthase [Tenacibaculum retecalamus]WBX70551.1 isochorismate synthase [Tenacibaculum retecalamus]